MRVNDDMMIWSNNTFKGVFNILKNSVDQNVSPVVFAFTLFLAIEVSTGPH